MLGSMIFPKNDPAVKRLHYYDRVVPVISVSSAIIIKRTADSQPRSLIPRMLRVVQYDILVFPPRIFSGARTAETELALLALRNSIRRIYYLCKLKSSVPRKSQIYSRPFSHLARDIVIINPRRAVPRHAARRIERGSTDRERSAGHESGLRERTITPRRSARAPVCVRFLRKKSSYAPGYNISIRGRERSCTYRYTIGGWCAKAGATRDTAGVYRSTAAPRAFITCSGERTDARSRGHAASRHLASIIALGPQLESFL